MEELSCHTSVVVAAVLLAVVADCHAQDAGSPTFNTTREACVWGQGRRDNEDYVTIDCTSTVGLISLDRILHGATPTSMGCDGFTSPMSACCPGYDPDRDCLFSSDQRLSELREICDGQVSCSVSLRKTDVNDMCPPRQAGNITYGADSSFAFVEFSCINVGLMSDICGTGSIERNSEVYLDTNVYHRNDEHFNKTCTCIVTTDCNNSLLFQPFIVDLAETPTDAANNSDPCMERITIADSNNRTLSSVEVDCGSNEADEDFKTEGTLLFQSQSNVADVLLRLGSSHTGKVLIKVVADEGSDVEVRCGGTTALPIPRDHQCLSDTTTSTSTTSSTPLQQPTTTTATTPSTSVAGDGDTPTPAPNTDGGRGSMDTTVAIAVAVVAFLIVLIILIIVIVIWRSRKRRARDNQQTVVYIVDDPDVNNPPPHYDAPPHNVTVDEVALDEKHPYEELTHVNGHAAGATAAVDNVDGPQVVEGAVGGFVNPQFQNDMNWKMAEGMERQ